MKTIYVMRHAKAKDPSLFGNDKDRKLTDKGIEAATAIAQKLSLQLKQPIDAIITSDAIRTQMTTKAIAFSLSTATIMEQPLLYNAPMEIFYEVIIQLPNEYNNILIVAHNPGISEFANSLGIIILDNMPTSGILGFTSNCTNWLNFIDAEKQFLYFDHPKNC